MIARIDLHPSLLAAASPPRIEDWRLAVHALVEDAEPADEAALSLFVDVDPGGLLLVWLRAGAAIARTSTPDHDLARHLEEYGSICQRLASLDEDSGGQRLEALDMAKKLAHDDAARTLRALCEPVELDHAVWRRLFTLVFALRVDTTALQRAHRRHGG